MVSPLQLHVKLTKNIVSSTAKNNADRTQ